MNTILHRTIEIARLRSLTVLLLALALTPWSVGSPAPVHALRAPELPVHASGRPQIRVQVILKTLYIYNDRDPFTSGDFEMGVSFHRCTDSVSSCRSVQYEGMLSSHYEHFGGDTHELITLDRLLPQADDPTWLGYDLSENAGYPLYDHEQYVLVVEMRDLDPGTNDEMGRVVIPLSADDLQLGARQQDAFRLTNGARGDFGLYYEVRVSQVPNLRPLKIERFDAPNSPDDLVCVTVINTGAEPAGPFQVTLIFDQQYPHNGVIDVGGLEVGKTILACAQLKLPANLAYWAAMVDAAQVVPEMVELDNEISERYVPASTRAPAGGEAAPTSGASPTPTPTPSQARPDLTVSTIKVNGQVTDGKDDCKDGKNTVAVVVKNTGAAKVDTVAVRLTVDGAQDDAVEQSVKGLETGQEREVRFEDVRLKKGEHTLTATVDPKDTVTESKADNNELKVTVGCTAAN